MLHVAGGLVDFSTTITGLAYRPSTKASKTLPGLAPFHCEEEPDGYQPAVIELMGTRLMLVPSISASFFAKYVSAMPGGPSNRIGVTSSPSRLSWLSAPWRLMSS